jgi:hypothetical protein
MKNQFYFTYREPIQPKEGDTAVLFSETQRSFNINKVVMTVREGDGLAIVLDDFHERIEEIPVKNAKGNITGFKNRHYTHQSVIHLEEEGANLFIKLTNCES